MSPLAIRRVTRRLRRHAVGVLIVLALGVAIGAHHSEMAAGEMDHGGMGTAVELCLAVFTAVGATVAAVAITLRWVGRWSRPFSLLPTGVWIVRGRQTPEPRAGPPPLTLLCVSRR